MFCERKTNELGSSFKKEAAVLPSLAGEVWPALVAGAALHVVPDEARARARAPESASELLPLVPEKSGRGPSAAAR